MYGTACQKLPEYVMGVKLILAIAGSLNCTLMVADWPGASVEMPGAVRNGDPLKLPVAPTNVTPLVSELNTIWNGPLIVTLVVVVFVMVTVPLNVRVARLNTSPDAVVVS